MPFLNRTMMSFLHDWRKRPDRKPLIIRGARQVGKTRLVQEFGRTSFASCATVNLERHAALARSFESNKVPFILDELSLVAKQAIVPGQTLLFLDEIQACPRALAALRLFNEEMPSLHVIAAGSLLDFCLRDFAHSMPVGRVEFAYMSPVDFGEFLEAMNERELARLVRTVPAKDAIGPAAHEQLMEMMRRYYFVGGMPEAVACYAESGSLPDVQRIQSNILTALEADFAKYGTRVQQETMRKILFHVPRNLGRKVKYVNIDRDVRSSDLKKALNLLELSRLVTMVRHTQANGVPLGAEADDTHMKPLFLDIGLCNNACGLHLTEMRDLMTVIEGGLAEQFVGQELRAAGRAYQDERLYYWHREQKNANAEVDYVVAEGTLVVPIEVKAGGTGSLRSLHVFLAEKKRHLAVRFNADRPSSITTRDGVSVKGKQQTVSYTLLSFPLYLAGQVNRLIEEGNR